ncbi:HEPN domain-containing protein [Citricoccus nitrophenolicus]|uniref:HEPN domain-containing protein n=1 Tax=Citricoccus nitrophenolicus TaxID=863575 RepID=A0ABV0IH33_9MICC
MATAALQEYRASSSTVQALLTLEATYSDPPSSTERDVVEGLRGGSIVLMVAAFENYLKASVAESLNRINAAQPSCDFSKLPVELQAQAVWTGLDYAMKRRPGDLADERAHRLPRVLSAARRISSGELISDAVAQTSGNPKSGTVKAIYKNVGYSRTFSNIRPAFERSWGQGEATTFIEDTLDTIVDKRHVVAHTASITTISRSDLGTWHRFLDVLAPVLDAAVERHVTRLIAQAQP